MPARFFNTAGPIKKDLHYFIDPLQRWDMAHVLELIEQQKYFVLHAPRQTGKTSALLALRDFLNASGQYEALYANVEPAQAARAQYDAAIKTIVDILVQKHATATGSTELDTYRKTNLQVAEGWGNALANLLRHWANTATKPVVLLLDEVDALVGDALISVLRQIRAGYPERPDYFPGTIILCGVRDVRDYRIRSSESGDIITGGSAFNIKAESLRLGDFSMYEVAQLLEQHTQETGQTFEAGALEKIWHYTQGQPWLVNALAYEATFNSQQGRDRSLSITVSDIEAAKEQLIVRRDTHLDQLADKLREPRVRQVMEPILSGNSVLEDIAHDDIQYAIDLGLVKPDEQQHIAIANQIYQEIIPRELVAGTTPMIEVNRAWYINGDGSLHMHQLMQGFQTFFRENSEHWLERFDYKESGPQLLLQAYLQRIVNGGGTILREYGLGRKRTDIYVGFKYSGGTQRIVIELKLQRGSLEKTIEQGLIQTAEYMDKSAATEGHLVIFDRDPNRTWEVKNYVTPHLFNGKNITIWGT
jgi:hypothetical protein